MGLEGMCNTTLVLELGLGLKVKTEEKRINKQASMGEGGFELCLSLGLSDDTYNDHLKKGTDNRSLYRQESVTPSFCKDTVVKRERDVEIEKTSSRISVDEDEVKNTKKKPRLSKHQSALLEESFKEHTTLNPKQKQELARNLNMRARQVEVWFQNRRARTKLKQTEIDCKFLRRCCETLTNENQRLQKELQELKALKLAQPLNIHTPNTTLTSCPSCERGNDIRDNKIPKTSFISVSHKPHFITNRFTNSSTAG